MVVSAMDSIQSKYLQEYPQFCGLRVLTLLVCSLASLLIISGCSEQPSVVMEHDKYGNLSTSFSPPAMLTQSRAVDQSALRLNIVVNQVSYPVEVTAGAESEKLTIPVTRGERLTIVVTWSELYKNRLLPLAQARTEETIPVNAEDDYPIVVNNAYRTDFDFDSDTVSNLAERNANTDPTVRDVLAEPVDNVPVKFKASTPERLKNVADNIDQSITANAIVDRALFTLTREGDNWVGETIKPANTDVLISYTFFSNLRPNVRLASWDGTINSNEAGTTVETASNQYDYQIDNDGDGIDNLEEIILGTNPENKSDPKPNPCDLSNFEIGCNKDTDGDGKPDSVETETADQDNDGIPDYRESKNDDRDEDQVDAELDIDEQDPCVPNDQAFACTEPGNTAPPVGNPPAEVPPAASPLSYDYFEGNFENMPDFGRLTAASSGTANTFALPPSNGVKFYALRYTGKIFVEETGSYTFYTESNDGSILYINNALIVNNDGSHSLVEASGAIALNAGLHDIVVEYFQNNGSEELIVSWSGPNFNKQRIPDAVLFAP